MFRKKMAAKATLLEALQDNSEVRKDRMTRSVQCGQKHRMGIKAQTKVGEHLGFYLAEGNPKATVGSVVRALFDGISFRRKTALEEGETTENGNNDTQATAKVTVRVYLQGETTHKQ